MITAYHSVTYTLIIHSFMAKILSSITFHTGIILTEPDNNMSVLLPKQNGKQSQSQKARATSSFDQYSITAQ